MSWAQVGRREMSSIVEFLLPEEALHVPFTSRLRSGARGCGVFCNRSNEGEIRECFLLTNGGLLLPAFTAAPGNPGSGRAADGASGPNASPTDRDGPRALLRDIRPPVHSIMGAGRFVGAAEACLPVSPSTRIEYFLMVVDRGTLRPALPLDDPRLRVRRADPFDAEALFPLQSGYEMEEVLIDPVHFSESNCMRLLKAALRDEVVYMAERDGVPVAKASTNARGYGVDQVGGVYTAPSERGKGFGAAVVTALVRVLLAEKPRVCLFVKKRNRPAIALYDRLGFVPVTDYVISYYGL
jgi:GNAT superfamily N-acetyltransferase